jgi:hypothetical protein
LFSSPFSVIVWRDGAIAHNFAKVLDGGINGIILHENVRLHLQRPHAHAHTHAHTRYLCSLFVHTHKTTWAQSVLARSRMGKEVVLTDIEACKHTVRSVVTQAIESNTNSVAV